MNMNKKLMASDFDGTIYFREEHYKKEDVKAIKEFQSNGNLFGICTGRSLNAIYDPIQSDGVIHPDFYIAATGAVIADKNKNILWADYLPYETVKQIYDLTNGNHMFIGCEGSYWSLSDYFLDAKEWPEASVKNEISRFKDSLIETVSFEFTKEEDLQPALAALKPVLNEISIHQNGPSFDIVAKGCTKASGVLKASEIFDIRKEDIAVIGDNYNDITMIEKCNLGYTFNRAPEAVKEAADQLVDTVSEALYLFEKK